MKNFDNWAKVYDLIYGKFDDDIKFYTNESKKSKGKVLEIACGTGRVYLELLKEGVNVYGIDISNAMLKVLKKKAKQLKLKPKVYRADMRNFRLRHKFSLIIIPARSFLHNLTIEEQLKALINIKNHLISNGKLILNFYFPNPKIIVKNYGKEIRQIIKTKEGKFSLTHKSYFVDEPNQILEVSHVLTKDNRVVFNDKFRIALIYKREFELLLRLVGFRKWKVYGSFDYEPLKSPKQEMVWIIQ